MAESDIVIEPVREGERPDWLFTSRAFEKNRDSYTPYMIADLERSYGSWDKVKYVLGFQQNAIDRWKDNQDPILEIGPGAGVSSEQLMDKGINLFVLEPTLKYPNHDKAKVRFSADRFKGRVSAANAADASLAFPDQNFQTAFAIGPNFQSYSTNELALVNQIGGVVHALKPNHDSFFAFEIDADGTVQFNIQITRNGTPKRFRLAKFLDEHNIRYSREKFCADMNPDANVIRIFRESEDGEDAAPKFDQALKQDLSQYIAP